MLSLQSKNRKEQYGYGVWLNKIGKDTYAPSMVGEDPGVSFISYYDTTNDIIITLVSNMAFNVCKMKAEILLVEELFL